MGNKVIVTRYLRPHQFSPWENYNLFYMFNDNLYGITFLFEIDYSERIVYSSWSVCNGDNFSKEVGKDIALNNGQRFKFDLRLVRECEGLVDGFVVALFNKYRGEFKYLPIDFKEHLIFLNKANRLVKGV